MTVINNSVLILRLNNQPHEFKDYVTIFQACLDRKIYVPRFCYHVALKIAGNCRMCLLEEKSSIKPLASCAITISNGMGIQTNTEMVKKAREGVLEYLLINHPLDCPICDQGGECDLQDQTMVFGADRGRFYEFKRSTPNKNFGYLIKTFLNRCIHCARCTRFMSELAGTDDLQLFGRGLKTEIGTFTDRFITSELSGNIIDLCPVGALTSKPYAFKARPWELVPVYSFDIMDAFGSNLEINFRGTEIMRVLPRLNRDINDEWITDKTRFFYDSIMLQRVSESYFIGKENILTCSWKRSFEIAKNCLMYVFEQNCVYPISLGFGSFTDLETTGAMKSLVSMYGLQNSAEGATFCINNDYRLQYTFNKYDLVSDLTTHNIIIINTNPRYESPLLNLQIRIQQQENEIEVLVIGFISNTNYVFNHVGFDGSKHSVINILGSSGGSFLINGATHKPEYLSNFQINHIWTKISHLSCLELLSPKNNFKGISNHFAVNAGIIDAGVSRNYVNKFFSVNMLHHMTDTYYLGADLGIYWPTKFYLEKVSSFLSNLGYYFSTITNIFGFNIRGTREEHRILRAFDEIIDDRLGRVTFDDLRIGINERPEFFSCGAKMGAPYLIEAVVTNSSIINYFRTNELCEISPVLGLCSRRYGVLNDYLWNVINILK